MATEHRGDPDTTWTVVLFFCGTVIISVLIVALVALFYNVRHEQYQRNIVAQTPQQLTQLRAEQEGNLNTYRWVDPQQGVVAIPIDRAMELTAGEIEWATPQSYIPQFN